MTPPAKTEPYKNHRFPGEIISHGVWLYYRFTMSYRDVQELLFERGINVTYEAIRKWCRKFGQDYANRLRRRRPQPGDKWIRTTMASISWCSVSATRRQQRSSFANCSKVSPMCHG
jgi:transposase-like protein